MTTEEIGLEFISHFGVKGMHWGVRKSPEARSERAMAKADKKWLKKTGSTKTYLAAHNEAAHGFNRKIGAFNNDPRWKGKDLTDPANRHIRADYDHEVEKMMHKEWSRAIVKHYGVSPSGKQKVIMADDGMIFVAPSEATAIERVRHAAGDMAFRITRDEKGFITSVNVDAMTQGEVFVTEYLSHFGVKGMHWGVHRSPSPVTVSDTIGRSSLTKTKIKTKGGEDHPAHEDAIKVAIARQKLKKSGPAALSNAELQTMAQRMNLEMQVRSLDAKRPKSIGKTFVDNTWKEVEKNPVGTARGVHKIAKLVLA